MINVPIDYYNKGFNISSNDNKLPKENDVSNKNNLLILCKIQIIAW